MGFISIGEYDHTNRRYRLEESDVYMLDDLLTLGVGEIPFFPLHGVGKDDFILSGSPLIENAIRRQIKKEKISVSSINVKSEEGKIEIDMQAEYVE